LAERILANWDDKPAKTRDRSRQTYYYLGVAEGTITLPRPPQPSDRWLCIYLIPEATPKETSYSKVPVHRLTAYFGEYSFHNSTWPGENIPFRIRGVTPGRYWVKAVWDKAKPYNFEDNYITGPPKPGDCESRELPVITVQAGETIADITIDCTAEVTGKGGG
jgi:hypothetical protein